MRAHLKLAIFIIATIVTLPLIMITRLSAVLGRSDAVFQGASQLLSLIPFRLGTYLRAAFYKHVCNDVHREVAIGFLTLFSHADTDMGRNVYIGGQSNIGSCSLGHDCLLGSGVHILSGKHQHDFSDPHALIRNQGGSFVKIHVGENCWIGNNAVVMANVGAHSIVAAGSVVVDEMPPHSIIGGNPARVIKSRLL